MKKFSFSLSLIVFCSISQGSTPYVKKSGWGVFWCEDVDKKILHISDVCPISDIEDGNVTSARSDKWILNRRSQTPACGGGIRTFEKSEEAQKERRDIISSHQGYSVRAQGCN